MNLRLSLGSLSAPSRLLLVTQDTADHVRPQQKQYSFSPPDTRDLGFHLQASHVVAFILVIAGVVVVFLGLGDDVEQPKRSIFSQPPAHVTVVIIATVEASQSSG